MKNLKFITMLLTIITLVACNQNDDPNDVSTFSESYSIKLDGSSSGGAIKEEIIVEREDVINDEKVNLNSVNSDGNTLTIQINIPIDLSPSGKKETIGISIQNLDANNIWNIEDAYQSFHYSQSSTQRKRAIVDYVIEGERDHFGSSNIFTKSTVSLKREGALLKGLINATVTNSRRFQVTINGTFEANLEEDELE